MTKLLRQLKKGEMPLCVVFFYSESLYPIFRAAVQEILRHNLPYLVIPHAQQSHYQEKLGIPRVNLLSLFHPPDHLLLPLAPLYPKCSLSEGQSSGLAPLKTKQTDSTRKKTIKKEKK